MDRKIKTYKGEWYTVNSIFGNDWARFFYLLGGREVLLDEINRFFRR